MKNKIILYITCFVLLFTAFVFLSGCDDEDFLSNGQQSLYSLGKEKETEYINKHGEIIQVVSKNPNIRPSYYNDYPISVTISDHFSISKKDEIIRGIEYLDSIAKGITFLVEYGNLSNSSSNIKVFEDMYAYELYKDQGGAAGCSTRNAVDAVQIKGDIHINLNVKEVYTYGITLHEFGHMLGLIHTSCSDNIMFVHGHYYTKESNSEKVYSDYEIDLINTLYPEFPSQLKYKITYIPNGGNIVNNFIEAEFYQPFIKCEIPTKLGYKFEGWYLTEDCNSTQFAKPNGETNLLKNYIEDQKKFVMIEDFNIYAKWSKKQIYTSCQFVNSSDYGSTSNSNKSIGDSLDLKCNISQGYKFLSWSKSDGTNEVIISNEPTSRYTITAQDCENQKNLTFIAKSEKLNYTISVNSSNIDYGTAYIGVSSSLINQSAVTVKSGTDNVAYLKAEPSSVRYLFDYWTLSNTEYASIININDSTTVIDTLSFGYGDIVDPSTIVITATFKQNKYDLIIQNYYNTNANISLFTIGNIGGSCSENNKYYSNETVSVNALANKGYVFIGWYLDDKFTDLISNTSQYTFVMPNNEYRLYAKFSLKTITITYDYKGGTNDANNVTFNYGDKMTGFVIAERNLYIFGGWYITVNSNAIQICDSRGNVNEVDGYVSSDLRLIYESNFGIYALWYETCFTMTIHHKDKDNGNILATKEYQFTTGETVNPYFYYKNDTLYDTAEWNYTCDNGFATFNITSNVTKYIFYSKVKVKYTLIVLHLDDIKDELGSRSYDVEYGTLINWNNYKNNTLWDTASLDYTATSGFNEFSMTKNSVVNIEYEKNIKTFTLIINHTYISTGDLGSTEYQIEFGTSVFWNEYKNDIAWDTNNYDYTAISGFNFIVNEDDTKEIIYNRIEITPPQPTEKNITINYTFYYVQIGSSNTTIVTDTVIYNLNKGDGTATTLPSPAVITCWENIIISNYSGLEFDIFIDNRVAILTIDVSNCTENRTYNLTIVGEYFVDQ